MYTYYTTTRPATVGTIPANGLVSMENFDSRKNVGYCLAWAKVVYDRQLTSKELRDYELSDNSISCKSIEVPDLSELAVEGFKNDAGLEEYERELEKVKNIYNVLFDFLLSGKIDFFYYDNSKGRNGFLRYIFAKSTKNSGIQQTTIWIREDGEEVPMSDYNGNNMMDFWEYGVLEDGVTVKYGKL